MKQKLMFGGLIVLLLATACKKDVPADAGMATEEAVAQQGSNEARWNQCRLVSDDRDGVFGSAFHYNNRGLVDEWKQDYYDGFPDIYSFTYDIFGRLKTCHAVFTYNGFAIDVRYQYQGNRLVKETIYQAGTSNVLNIIATSYNYLGQVTKRGSTMYNEYCTFSWNIFGNNTLVNYYVDDALYIKEEFTYRKKNRNPLGSLSGMPFVVFQYDFVFSSWWETSDKFTVYDDGVPTVTVDYDPATAVMDIGQHQYLNSVTNFDRVTGQNTTATFAYENCGGPNDNAVQGHRNVTPVKGSNAAIISKFKRDLLTGQMKNIKEAVKKLKSDIHK